MNEQTQYAAAERFKDFFAEIDSDVTVSLRGEDEEYDALFVEITELQKDFPVIARVAEGGGAVSMSDGEHDALLRYLDIKNDMCAAERMQIYFRGHADCFAYLKKIGAV